MSRTNKTSYINISELVNNISANKENNTPNSKGVQLSSRKNSQSSTKKVPPKVQIKIEDLCEQQQAKNIGSLRAVRKDLLRKPLLITPEESPILERGIESDRSDSISDPLQAPQKLFSRLSGLIGSQRMFIDPDRWEKFLGQAEDDPSFHRALSAFLYSYFIQHYQ